MAQKKKAKEEVANTCKQEEVASNIEEIKEEKKSKLHVLASDRLNSLINEANELGITEVVQVLNSDKYGQFYMVYKD